MTEDRSPQPDVLAIHVMGALSRAQRRGRVMTLEDVAREVGARKADVRAVVSQLDRQGYMDAMRMRLTMVGFAIGAGVRGSSLKAMRKPVAKAPVLRVAA
jgi:hypothetical protein